MTTHNKNPDEKNNTQSGPVDQTRRKFLGATAVLAGTGMAMGLVGCKNTGEPASGDASGDSQETNAG